MSALWIVYVGLIVLALAFILWPLLRADKATESGVKDASDEESRAQLNTSIYKERLLELQSELRLGTIDEKQFGELELELQSTLLSDIPEQEVVNADQSAHVSNASTQMSRGQGVTVGLVVTVVFAASVFGFYGFFVHDERSTEWIALQEKMRPVLDQTLYGLGTPDKKLEYSYADFIRSLQSRLQTDAGNVAGWVILGKAYQQVDMPELALEAFEKAYQISPMDIEVMLGVAGAKIYSAKGRLDDESRQLIAAVLRREPSNANALMLKGMSSFSSGLYQEAIDAWQMMLQLGEGQGTTEQSSKGKLALQKSIALAREKLAGRLYSPTRSEESSTQLKPIEKGDSDVQSEGRLTEIKVMVDISPTLLSKVNSTDILFIFAKAVDGPPMPVAAVKRTDLAFPMLVTLDDSTAVTARFKLSNFDQVRLEARISKSGQPTATSGDFQASAKLVKLKDLKSNPAKYPVKLVIDSVL